MNYAKKYANSMHGTITKSRHSTVVEESVRGISDPVRGVTPAGGMRLRGICTKYLKKVVSRSLSYHSSMMKVLKPIYESRLADFNMGKIQKFHVEPKPLFTYNQSYKCGCGECEKKDISGPEADRIKRIFRELFGASTDDKLIDQSRDFLKDLMDSAKVNPNESDAILKDAYRDIINAAFDDAYAKAYDEWKKQPEKWREGNPFKGKKSVYFDKDFAFVKKLYADGYKLVSHAVTTENLSGIREIMNNSLMKGLSWEQTARLLDSRFGTVEDPETGLVRGGGISHWQRVVRTEMATAIDKAHHERYQGMGVEWVQISISPTACEICRWYKDQNNGIYPMDEAPDITEDTHPNCRCVFLPYWNLPRGVDAEHELIPFPD